MKVHVTADNVVTELLCDTDGCLSSDVYLCPGGVIACENHLPKSKGDSK